MDHRQLHLMVSMLSNFCQYFDIYFQSFLIYHILPLLFILNENVVIFSSVLLVPAVKSVSEFYTSATTDASGLFFIPEYKCLIVAPVKLSTGSLEIIFLL